MKGFFSRKQIHIAWGTEGSFQQLHEPNPGRSAASSRKRTLPITPSIDFQLSHLLDTCEEVRQSVRKTNKLLTTSLETRTPYAFEDSAPPVKFPQIRKKVKQSTPQPSLDPILTFDNIGSERNTRLLNRVKRDFGRTSSEEIRTVPLKAEVSVDPRQRTVLNRILSLGSLRKVPSEYIDDKWVNKYDLNELKEIISMNQGRTPTKQVKHIRNGKSKLVVKK